MITDLLGSSPGAHKVEQRREPTAVFSSHERKCRLEEEEVVPAAIESPICAAARVVAVNLLNALVS
ncbi:hypothetical protein EYF80_022731 [Liparis tanakae]|uniref:Uncharacterized protein n=1 Tax=Liparis tanakae TaxID=230148 RepID=A0A4Z2HP94_9TELE|nr:hypothetical protein EYF80_022731 [Liparis tanakae]